MDSRAIQLSDDPEWFKDAIFYQLHVKTFMDADGNGIGDFKGLLKKLDYLQDLGVTAIWLLPFYPSPQKDDGYDISDYFDIHPDYGSLKDFREFVKSAHYRGIRVITELVLNHTSDQHRWFQLARRSDPGSPFRDFYVWSDTPEWFQEARIIFQDFESSNWSWDHAAKAYYWHRFYSHQPDLNFDNPKVRKTMRKVIDFWMDMGVDGLRLDAVPYLLEREGTNCENLPETHEYLKELRNHVDTHYKSRMLLAEANQWPENAVDYFGDGDECHMAFHFPIMPRLYMALWMEDRFPLIDILEQTPSIPESSQWAIFLRNHDELTLEMVTDEERDYMYRVYARDPQARINLGIRRRLAPLLNNNRRKIELMNFLLFSLPGTPVVYYGDEIGMGDNYYLGDRNGVRTPMQWSPDRNAGFSMVNPQQLYLPVIMDPEYHFESLNVENQTQNPSSLLWWTRRVIATRRRFQAFGRGDIEYLLPDNHKVLAFIRKYGEERILVVINLSRFPQVAELDLSAYAGYIPVEVFSGNRFPKIRESAYVFTLGVHDYFWFSLQSETELEPDSAQVWEPPRMILRRDWREVFDGANKMRLEERILPGFLRQKRWFRSKSKKIRKILIAENIPLDAGDQDFHLLQLEVSYTEGEAEIYLLPVGYASDTEVSKTEQASQEAKSEVLAWIKTGDDSGRLYDALQSPGCREALFSLITKSHSITGTRGHLVGLPGKQASEHLSSLERPQGSRLLRAEQSNTSVFYEDGYILKFYRSVDEGINPDTEITSFLTDKAEFPHIPSYAGQIRYSHVSRRQYVLGMLQEYVPNQGDAWTFTQDHLHKFFENAMITKQTQQQVPGIPLSPLHVGYNNIPQLLHDCIGGYFLEVVHLLGRITGQLHLSLSLGSDDPAFKPEPFSWHYQRSMYQSMRNLCRRTITTLKRSLPQLTGDIRQQAQDVVDAEDDLLAEFAELTRERLDTIKIRNHGDYHLGQVLYTGNSFVIVDFEGEPARPLSERRLKRSCLRDVAGMVRSFHYAAHHALHQHLTSSEDDLAYLASWIDPWFRAVSGMFLSGYQNTIRPSSLLPSNKKSLELLFRCLMLEKAIYEVGYELNNRPDWLSIPVHGVKQLLAREI
ncbi:MAG: maltose alpha-D-glucosyltransferase [Desulfohalobiaceae bacterium]